MESEGLLPCSQQPATGQSSPHDPFYFLKVRFNIILPSATRSSSWSRSLTFSHQTPVFKCPPLCPAHLILLDLNTRIVLLWSSSLCSFLPHFSVTSFPLGLASYSQTPSAFIPASVWAIKFHSRCKTSGKL